MTRLRDESIEIQNLWVTEGCPHQGPIHAERLRIRAAYKRAIRAAQRAPKQAAWDRLHSSLAENHTNEFWKSWKKIYNKNKSHLPPVVEGCSSGEAIADCFKECLKKTLLPTAGKMWKDSMVSSPHATRTMWLNMKQHVIATPFA